jgi:4-phospho-D-threonate 3-dehydrogenase / 4-phospho-D-erythronate 3-dehydrogenase
MSTPRKKPLLGISMGDPGGIGPEICAKALNDPGIYRISRSLVVGDGEVMAEAIRFCGLPLSIRRCEQPEAGLYVFGTVDVLDLKNLASGCLRPKQVTAEQGKAAFEYVTKVIELALAGRVDATVTAPISKAAINAAGYHYAGHTEIYAEFTGTRDYAMMLADGNFRVAHVSTHAALRQACDLVRKARVGKVIELAHRTLLQLGIASPRLAVAGLNPHCGEGGIFGTEDDLEIAPAVAEARVSGINVEGPLPADTVFAKMLGGAYDLVVVMYHDQGHIPTKLLGFKYDGKTDTWGSLAGVNLTLGLPIIRTSVDHGTAFDKAGEGRANPQSLLEAIRLAVRLAGGAEDS